MAYRDNSTITPGATPYANPAPAPTAAATKPAPMPSASQYPSYTQPSYQRPGLPATTSSYYASHPYYAQYAGSPAGTPGAKAPMPQNQYYYNPYPQYGAYGYGQYPQQAQQQAPQPGTPRAIPNMAKPAPSYANGWNPTAAAASNATLPMHLRKTGTPGPGTPPATGYAPGTPTPVYPPAYGAAYPGFPVQRM